MEKMIKVTWKKSTIGKKQDQKDTIKALGLKRLHQEKIFKDSLAIRGMIKKVIHLLDVEPIDK